MDIFGGSKGVSNKRKPYREYYLHLFQGKGKVFWEKLFHTETNLLFSFISLPEGEGGTFKLVLEFYNLYELSS